MTYAIFADPGSTEVAVVRVGLFKDIAAAAKPVAITNLEGESTAIARARRLKNWTPVVWLPD